jgi:23S rRNA (adenine2503-C2)-methyltransferase
MMSEEKKHILTLYPDELELQFAKWNEKSYRVKQLCNWLYQNKIIDLQKMGNLSQALRNHLAEQFSFYLPVILSTSLSKDKSIKYLLEMEDKERIEMVVMPGEKKQTLCISTQIGCARNCLFCATGKLGLKRNLSISEIVSQVYLAQQLHKTLTNIVFMGMGEPLDNLENVIQAIRLLQHDALFSFSPRRITVSTAGVVPNIYTLADSNLKLKLAVSLNAVFDEKRNRLMPVNKLYPLAELKKSLLYFTKKNPFRVTLEYVLLKDFNMGDDDISELRKFSNDLSCKINLIAWNPVKDLPFEAPEENDVNSFREKLHSLQAAITLRSSRGADINAACGQLAAEYKSCDNK